MSLFLELYGQIGWDVCLDDFNENLARMRSENPEETIMLRINSAGGDFESGFAIAHLIEQDGNIDTINIGLAASIAGFILLKGRKRYSASSSMTMLHKAHLATCGNSDELLQAAVILSEYDAELIKTIAARTKLGDAQTVKELLKEPGLWANSESALEKGIVDEIIISEAKAELPKNSVKFVNENYKSLPFNVLNQIITPPTPEKNMNEEQMKLMLELLGRIAIATEKLVELETAEPPETDSPHAPENVLKAVIESAIAPALEMMNKQTEAFTNLLKTPVNSNPNLVYGLQDQKTENKKTPVAL